MYRGGQRKYEKRKGPQAESVGRALTMLHWNSSK
jgi:hypothetical protein